MIKYYYVFKALSKENWTPSEILNLHKIFELTLFIYDSENYRWILNQINQQLFQSIASSLGNDQNQSFVYNNTDFDHVNSDDICSNSDDICSKNDNPDKEKKNLKNTISNSKLYSQNNLELDFETNEMYLIQSL